MQYRAKVEVYTTSPPFNVDKPMEEGFLLEFYADPSRSARALVLLASGIIKDVRVDQIKVIGGGGIYDQIKVNPVKS